MSTLKLYTEEQVILIIQELKKAFLPENVECDGAYCMGCWKDVVRNTINMVYNLTPIELPNDEEIEKQLDEQDEYSYARLQGAIWMREQILNQVK